MAKRLAIYSPVGSMALPDQAFGKDVANLGLYRALARYGGFERIDIQTALPVDAGQLAEGLLLKQQLRAGLAVPTIARRSLLDLQGAVDAGLLLRGQPYLGELAWMRRRFSFDQAYSLVGLIHTLAPPAIREQIGAVLETPVRPWDALICTSPAVRQGVEAMLAAWQEHLTRELGAQRFSWPQLPIIPLAVDVPQIRAQAQAPGARESLRQELGLAAEDLMVLWVGRLSYFEKAFPQPMFAAVGQAARRTGKHLHFALLGWFANGQADLELFKEAAQLHAPNLEISVLDGRNSETMARCWAAADVFLSLVDNAQETFGLAPVEAMAAGLPLVVSDWNGYRFTVKDQQEGFLIPTLAAPGGAIAEELAAAHQLGLQSYQNYVGAAAQHTAVAIEQAAAALVRLVESPELRRRMGEAGQRTAAQRFDWPVVAAQHLALFAELESLRTSQASAPRPGARASHPLRGNPLADFAHFASHQLTPETCLILGHNPAGFSSQTVLDQAYGPYRASQEELQQALAIVSADPGVSVKQLLAGFAIERHDSLQMGLVWMIKIGILDWIKI